MEIRKWHYYVIFNFVMIKYLEAKTISLNEVITAESQQKEAFETTLPPKSAGTVLAKRTKRLKSASRNVITSKRKPSRVKNFLESILFQDHIPLGEQKISPLKYKKTFLIKSPIKPKKHKVLQKARYKRKNQSLKREITGNEDLQHKYIPLLKSLSMLFDNILNADASESYEFKPEKFKRNRFYSEEIFEVSTDRIQQYDTGVTESNSQEEADTFSPASIIETTTVTKNSSTNETTPTTANTATTRNIGTFRQNKDIPVLLPRNTFSARRDDNGIGERSRATLHGNFERNITRHYGDYEHDARCGQNVSCTEDDEKNTDSSTRDNARGFRFPRPTGSRNNTRLFPRENRTDSENVSKIETTDDHITENQLKNRRNETEGGRILQEPMRRLRGFTFEELVQPKEIREESIVNVTHDNAGYQRVTDRGSPFAKEDKKVRKGNETVNFTHNLNSTAYYSKNSTKKSPIVMIFDGYSTARHKNGDNKFSEKSIRIHS